MNISLAAAVVKASVVTEPSIPSPPAATKANMLAAFTSAWRTGTSSLTWRFSKAKPWEEIVNGLIYLIGLIVVVLFILSFFGLR